MKTSRAYASHCRRFIGAASFIACWVGLSQERQAHGAETGGEVTSLMHALKKQVSEIGGLKCQVRGFERESTAPSSILEWTENATSYKFTFKELDTTGSEVFWSSMSSNKSGSMVALEHGRYLNIEKTERPVPPEVRNVPLPTAQLEFIFSTMNGDAWVTPSIAFLRDDKVWGNFAERTKYIGKETVGGRKMLIFEVGGARDRFIDMPVTYRVYVDPTDGYAVSG